MPWWCTLLSVFYHPKQVSCWNSMANVFVSSSYHPYGHIVTMHQTYFPMNFKCWFVLDGKKKNNHMHRSVRNYTQWQLHFHYCILYIFVQLLLRNFYSVARNSKIISTCNFMLICSQNAEKKIGKLTFETTLVMKMFSKYYSHGPLKFHLICFEIFQYFFQYFFKIFPTYCLPKFLL